MNLNLSILIILVTILLGQYQPVNSQSNNISEEFKDLQKEILYFDSIFWESYNTCNVEIMNAFFTEDIEFYHDKAGLTISSDSLMKSIKNGMCGNGNWRLRRVAVEGSLKVYPINNYGAIISGEHYFYIKENGKNERLDGLAKFTNVWQFKNEKWKMSRVLSYDHGPAPYQNTKIKVHLNNNILDQYQGRYKATQTGNIDIIKEEDSLIMQVNNMDFILYPEADNLFFLMDRNVQFEFVKDQNNNVKKIIIRENGEIVEEAMRSE